VKLATFVSSIFISLVNNTLDSGEFNLINVRILLIFNELSESMMMRLVLGFASGADSRGDVSDTWIDSILYAERISEFLRSFRKVVLPTPIPHTRVIYWDSLFVKNSPNFSMSLVRGNIIIKGYLTSLYQIT
jgi:hypothetical protein